MEEYQFRLESDDLSFIDIGDRVYIDEYKEVGNGQLYKGQWNKRTGVRDGVGIQMWPDGTRYEGMWSMDKANGKGRMMHANGAIYCGNWKND